MDSSRSPMRDRASSGAQMNIHDITSFLQKEFSRFEQERSSFQLEREEFQRKIVQLEQFKKSQEKIQFDLLRRIKMLEFALRNERFKLQQVMDTIKASDPELHQTLDANVVSLPSVKSGDELKSDFTQEMSQLPATLAQNLLAQAPKSSEVLKKCLEDLNSSDVLALLAKTSNVPAESLNINVQNNLSANISVATATIVENDDIVRGEDTLEKQGAIATATIAADRQQQQPAQEQQKQPEPVSTIQKDEALSSSNNNAPEPPLEDNIEDIPASQLKNFEKIMKRAGNSNSAPRDKKVTLVEPNSNARKSKSDDNRAWASQLKSDVLEKLNDVKLDKQAPPKDTPRFEFPSSSSNLSQDAVSSTSSASSASSTKQNVVPLKVYKSKCALYHHLDGVRCVAFHETEPIVLSCSEDATVKMWNMSDINSHSTIVQPVHTFRGHIGAVYSVVPFKSNCYSAGEDATIKIWELPPHDQDPYTNHGNAMPYIKKSLAGHTDIIWALSAHKTDPFLLSASADGSCRLWNQDKDSQLQQFTLDSVQKCTPTSITYLWNDSKKCIVSYSNSVVAMFDVETGKLVWSMPTVKDHQNVNHLIYQVVAHPTLPMLITANEDKFIRFLDANTGKCTFEMVGHKDSVSSLSIDSSGLYFVSGGHDANLRIWDLTSKHCVQDISVTHRKKLDEAVHSVAFHPTKSIAASAGADSIVKIYS